MNTSCETCRKEFKTYQSRLDTGHDKYCSRECLLKGREVKKIYKKCTICEKSFYTKKARVSNGRGKHCSRKCYAESKVGTVGYWKNKKRETPWMIGEASVHWKGGYTGQYAQKKLIGGKHTNTEWEAARQSLIQAKQDLECKLITQAEYDAKVQPIKDTKPVEVIKSEDVIIEK